MTTTLCWLLIVFALITAIPASCPVKRKVTLIEEWKNLEFAFDSQAQKDYAIKKGFYSPQGQKRLYELDIYYQPDGETREFVSIPRISQNIPFTLATVDKNSMTSNGRLLRAYPNMDMHLNRTCSGIIGVFRLTVDNNCNQLWIIDSGRDITLGANSQICPPKILVFNLRTDRLVDTFFIPDTQYYAGKSAFNSITLHPDRSCDKQIAYVTDTRGTGLLVYDQVDRKSWRTFSALYGIEPDHQVATIAGESFDLPDGIYTVAPNLRDENLYFHPFASLDEMIVPLSVIHNEILWTSNGNTEKLFKRIGKRPTQSTSEAFDSRGNLWFALLDPLVLVCWNPRTPYAVENFKVVLYNENILQFVSGLKIRKDPKEGEILIATSNRSQKHYNNTVNPDEINYRAFSISIKNVDCNPMKH